MCQFKSTFKMATFNQWCDCGTKNQYFWPTNKLISNKDVMLFENDYFIADILQVANVLNKQFNEIAQGIGFIDPIPNDYHEKSTMTTWFTNMILFYAWQRSREMFPKPINLTSKTLHHMVFMIWWFFFNIKQVPENRCNASCLTHFLYFEW